MAACLHYIVPTRNHDVETTIGQGRERQRCSLPDGSDLNAWMVRQGWAVASGFVKIYGDEEAEAEAQKRGLWAGSFDPPWKWREQHKPK